MQTLIEAAISTIVARLLVFLFIFEEAPISWKSKLQPIVVLSTPKAEHRVFINVAKEAVWIRVLLCKLKHIKDKSTSIYCDNIGAIQLVKNSVFHALTKYIELQHYFI